VPGGLDDVLAEVALAPPLLGRLAITTDESAHVWLLGAGVVTSHLTLPDTPGFEAVVSLARDTPSALREAVEPHLGALAEQAVPLMLAVVQQDTLPEATHRSLRARLLTAARRGLCRAEVFRTPLFPAYRGPDGGRQPRLSLSELGGGGALPCLDPGDDVSSFLLPDGPVLVMDAEERGQLAQLLGVRFRPVERRHTRHGWAARLRKVRRVLLETAARCWSRLRHPGGGSPLPDSALSAAERVFLRELRAARAPESALVFLTHAAAPPRLTPGGWHLGRAHADVVAAVRSVGADPSAAYVAALVLCDDAAPRPRVRDDWRERMTGTPTP
jgi:hypothetical protein